jgi:hypothetical protein
MNFQSCLQFWGISHVFIFPHGLVIVYWLLWDRAFLSQSVSLQMRQCPEGLLAELCLLTALQETGSMGTSLKTDLSEVFSAAVCG